MSKQETVSLESCKWSGGVKPLDNKGGLTKTKNGEINEIFNTTRQDEVKFFRVVRSRALDL